MIDEEMQRTMQFILKAQAQLTATVGRLSETVERISEKVDRTADSVIALLAIAEIHEREITSISDAGRATDERLSALINTVERLISEGRNAR
ncbi:MAG: hypothetical protein ACR2GW_11480 [Pyrinomonadaceae bacterium]|jgi:ABC-type transporter Mla subunit MlaD|nr:hypothetical protein [Pyrinomonadaceae bacterium]